MIETVFYLVGYERNALVLYLLSLRCKFLLKICCLFDFSVESFEVFQIIVILFKLNYKLNIERFSNWEKVDNYECFVLRHRNLKKNQNMYFQPYPESRQPG